MMTAYEREIRPTVSLKAAKVPRSLHEARKLQTDTGTLIGIPAVTGQSEPISGAIYIPPVLDPQYATFTADTAILKKHPEIDPDKEWDGEDTKVDTWARDNKHYSRPSIPPWQRERTVGEMELQMIAERLDELQATLEGVHAMLREGTHTWEEIDRILDPEHEAGVAFIRKWVLDLAGGEET